MISSGFYWRKLGFRKQLVWHHLAVGILGFSLGWLPRPPRRGRPRTCGQRVGLTKACMYRLHIHTAHTLYHPHTTDNSVQFSSVTQSCPTVCDPMNCSTPGLPVHHQLPEFTQTHVHRVGDAIQPSHPLSSPSPPAHNPSQHQGLFQGVSSSHQVAKALEFQLQHQSFQ